MSYSEIAWYVCDTCGTSFEVAPGSPCPEGLQPTNSGHICDGCADKLVENIQGLAWESGLVYSAGQLVTYDAKPYRVLQGHTSQSDWTPDAAASLFAPMLAGEDEIPPWEQPDSTNPYMIGDKVLFEGDIYESVIDNNVWSPATYPQGWQIII